MMPLLPTARLLPLLVTMAIVILGFKGYNLYEGLTWGQKSFAEEKKEEATPTPTPAPAQAPAVTPAPPAPAPVQEAVTPAPQPVATEPEEAAQIEEELPQSFTASEVEVLQNLSKRRAELDSYAAQLNERQALISAAEATAEQKIKELEALKAEIQTLIRTVDDQQTSRIQSMVKMYETMKPREAAAILEQLDMSVTLDILERMKEGKSAAVLASMDPGRAGTVTVEMSRRRTLPEVPK
jgi:flagellar motility protein MotE (MotC chaperone)